MRETAFPSVPLRRVATIWYGLGQPPPQQMGGVPFIRATDISRGKVTLEGALTVDPDAVPSGRNAFLRPGDIIVVRSGAYTGDSAIIPPMVERAVAGYDMVISTRAIDPRYLAWVLLSPRTTRSQIDLLKQRAAQPHLNVEELGGVTVPLPRSDTQRAIASYLDRETARIDTLIAKKERLLDLLEEKRAALITRAVTKGLDPDVPMKDSGVEWLGEYPRHWEVRQLARCTDPAIPIVYGILLPGPNREIGVPYIGAGDVKHERLYLEHLPRTTHEIAAKYPRSCLKAGDIVYAIRGSFGAVAIVPFELEGANLSRDAARIAVHESVHNRWLLWALRSASTQAQFSYLEMGAAVTGTNIRDLRRVLLPVPPRDEQLRLAAFLDAELIQMDLTTRKITHAISLLREYRSALITAAVTGQVDIPSGEDAA